MLFLEMLRIGVVCECPDGSSRAAVLDRVPAMHFMSDLFVLPDETVALMLLEGWELVVTWDGAARVFLPESFCALAILGGILRSPVQAFNQWRVLTSSGRTYTFVGQW